jgi:pilus assembly protein CpaF
VTEVVGMEGDTITTNDIFSFHRVAGSDANGRALGYIEPTGVRPGFVDRLHEAGITLPAGTFGNDAQTGTERGWGK